MAYSTRAQIEARLPSVGIAGESFDATVEEALLWADAQINLALASSYTTPFSPVPGSISQLAADFGAVFVLRAATESEPSQAAAETLYKQARETLDKMVKSGVPELEESGEDLPDSSGIAYHSGYGNTSAIVDMTW